MRHRGFSLIEVLVALAIFALAAVGLGAAYTNVLLGRQALKQYDVGAEDLARCRAALLETVNFADLETGGAVNLPDGRIANWKAQAEPTEVSDLFSVTLSIEMPSVGGTEAAQQRDETHLLLRPTWSTASDRKVIRDAAKARLLKERGYEESTGGGGMVSTPTARKALGGNNQNGEPADSGKGKAPGGKAEGGKGKAPGGKTEGGKGEARPGGNNTKGNPSNQGGNTNGPPSGGTNPAPGKNQPSGGKSGGAAPTGGQAAPRPIL